MKGLAFLNSFTTRFWGLPLLLSVIVLPVAITLSVRLWLPEGYVYLIYLPLAVMIALMMVFSWAALPGITIALCLHYFSRYHELQAASIVLVFLTALILCWGGYRRRWNFSLAGRYRGMVRFFWLIFALPTLLVTLLRIATPLSMLPLEHSVFSRTMFSLHSLLNYQSVLLASFATCDMFYILFRVLKKPSFLNVLRRRCHSQFAATVTLREFAAWGLLLLSLLAILIQFTHAKESLLATDYGIPLLLPLMLWAAARFGYLFTSICWGTLLVVLYQLRDRFMHPATEPEHLAVVSANLLIFTLIILLIATISTRQRRLMEKVKHLALTDPIVGLPNLRALTQQMSKTSGVVLCFLRIPDLDRLSRTYGLQLRIQYKRNLAQHLRPWLLPGEEIYQLPGFDLVMRLEKYADRRRIESLEMWLKEYQLNWVGLPIHPDVGISFGDVVPPVSSFYELLGEMSELAEVALHSGHAENLQQKPAVPVQQQISEKRAILQDIQRSLQEDGFQLMAQKIQGMRGDDYYRITRQLVNRFGEEVGTEKFITVIQDFGLTWEVDSQLIDQTLGYMNRYREWVPGMRFSINIFAATLCRPQLASDIASRLKANNIEPWQLIIDVAGAALLSDDSWGNRTITQLRHLGCRVAIDDVGIGYGNHSHLKRLQADIVAIDGSYVRNMLQSSLDYKVIESICAVARLKRMQILACEVDTEGAAVALRKLGVDYLQGDLMAAPLPLDELAFTVARSKAAVNP